MAHYDDYRQAPPASKASRATAIALGLTLTAASAVSLIYLSQRWQEAAPYRQARALEAADRRAVAEAARAAEALERARPPVPVSLADPSDVQMGDVTVNAPPRPSAAAAQDRRVELGPLRWLSEPRFDIPRDILEKPGPERVTVRFECKVDTLGSLYGCVGSETPRGFGLLPAARRALPVARMMPLTENGRVVEGSITFGYSWTRPRAISAPSSVSIPDEAAPASPPVEAEAPPTDAAPAEAPSAEAPPAGQVQSTSG